MRCGEGQTGGEQSVLKERKRDVWDSRFAYSIKHRD